MTRVRIGDVAAIALNDDTVAYVHVLARHPLLDWYFGVFDGAHARGRDVPVDAAYALLGHADGGHISNGEWPRVGRVKPDPSRFVFPRFKIWQGGPDSPTHVVSWDESERRIAEPDEVPVLLGMTTSNAEVLALAARALHGFAPWRPEYDDFRTERVVRSHGRAEPDGKDPRPITPRVIDPDTSTELLVFFVVDGGFVEATQSVRWRDVDGVKREWEAFLTGLDIDDFGFEVALPPR